MTRRRRPGFTLAELMIVLLIIGLCSAVVVPALPPLAVGKDDSGAANEIARLLRQTRNTAMERGKRMALVLDSESGRYWVEAVHSGDTEVIDSGTIHLADGVGLSPPSARPRFRFGSLGVSAADSLAVMTNDGPVNITVDRWTGRVALHGQ